MINKNKVRLNNNIFMCEDMLFVLKYAMQSKRFGAIEESLYNYNRKNENSVSSKINFEYFNNLIDVMKEIEKILNKKKYLNNVFKVKEYEYNVDFILSNEDMIKNMERISCCLKHLSLYLLPFF